MNADFSFSTTWQGCAFTRKSKTVDLRKITARPARQDLEAIVKICPQCTKINLYGAPIPPYKTMVSLVKKYPKVDFLFAIRIHEYSLSSLDVAFSTLIKDQTCTRLTAAECEVLGACKYLKVLDLGHNNLYSLDFLKYVPKLEMLIKRDRNRPSVILWSAGNEELLRDFGAVPLTSGALPDLISFCRG